MARCVRELPDKVNRMLPGLARFTAIGQGFGMRQDFDCDVIICGGGPVGMGLAIDLGQRGVRTAVVERYPEPQPIPKGQNLTQRTAEHFRAWGCEDALRRAHPLPEGAGTGGVNCYGTLLGAYSYSWINRAAVTAYYAADNVRLPQYETENVLRARAAELDAVEVFYGWSGTTVAQSDDSVTLTITEHNGPARRPLTARYLVGCDGSNSTVRTSAGITQTRNDHDRQMALVVFRSTDLHDLLGRYPGKAFFNALHPDFEGYWQFFGRVDVGHSWFFHAPVPVGTTANGFDFAAMIHRAVGAEFALDIDHVGFWDLRFACADSYCAGRVFVAGDAAHSHPPYGGFGINIGLEDARNLGWKLAARIAGGAQALLDSYDAERRPVFQSTAQNFIGRFIEEDRDFLATYNPSRDRAAFEAAWANRAGGDASVTAYEPNYEGSPIIPGQAGRTPGAIGDHQFRARAGHHLAPQPAAKATTTFDHLRDGFTLLMAQDRASGELARSFRAAARRLGVPLSMQDVLTQSAVDQYGAPLILVRPDHFVAWAGESCEPLDVLRTAVGG